MFNFNINHEFCGCDNIRDHGHTVKALFEPFEVNEWESFKSAFDFYKFRVVSMTYTRNEEFSVYLTENYDVTAHKIHFGIEVDHTHPEDYAPTCIWKTEGDCTDADHGTELTQALIMAVGIIETYL